MPAAEPDQTERGLQPRLPKPRHVAKARTKRKWPRGAPAITTSKTIVLRLPADADFVRERGRHARYLLAVGGAGDGDAGLVEDALDARPLRIQIAEQLGDQHAVLAAGIVDDLAGRGRGEDQRIVGRADRRQTMREGTEAALVRIAAGSVEHDQLGVRAVLADGLEHGLDRNALAADVAFLPDPRIDRDHVALAPGLDA